MNKIEEISKGVDEHLRKLESFMSLIREVKSSIDELRHSKEKIYFHELQQLKRDFEDIKDQLKKHGLPQTNHYEKILNEIKHLIDDSSWPIAVPNHLICNDEEKSFQRADSILDILVSEHLKGKKFLDFGCGAGHVVIQAKTRETAMSFGYDVDLSSCKFDSCDFTSNFSVVKEKSPYDVILLHDVLDHAVIIDPIEILTQAKSVLARNGRVYVRNHPWSSRHGGHLYQQKNKAFLHLILDEIELTRTGGLVPEHNVGVTTPLETYRHWFNESGFKIICEMPIRDKVEEFFINPSTINDRLKKHFGDTETMKNHLEISFVEYVLEFNSHQQIF